MHVPLVEMTQADAASHATSIFLEVRTLFSTDMCSSRTYVFPLKDCFASSVQEMQVTRP
jgi:hypothetical protein